MAKKKSNMKTRILFFIAIPLLNGGYQLIAPFFAKTKLMKEEALKLDLAIKQLNTDEANFSSDWKKKTAAEESVVAQKLPDQIVPAEILRYFATNFEQQHPEVEFNSVLPQSVTESTLVSGKSNAKIKIRTSKLQIKARMPSELALNYLEYVEKYQGLISIKEVSLSPVQDSGPKQRLQMDLGLELYLTPKELLPKEKKEVEKNDRQVAAIESASSPNWFSVNDISKEENVGLKQNLIQEKAESKSEVSAPKPPSFKIKQFVGTSVVINESLFEVGDRVQGWSITKINPNEKFIILKKENVLFKVVKP